MQEDMEEDVNSNTSSIGKDTQLLMTARLTTMTTMLQNSSGNSTSRPPQMDKRYKETSKSLQKSSSSNTPKHLKNFIAYTLYSSLTPINIYATTT
jgi:hypothetical protein